MKRFFGSRLVQIILLLTVIAILSYSQLRRTIALPDSGFQFTHHVSWRAGQPEELVDGIGDGSVRKATMWDADDGVIHVELLGKDAAGTPQEVVTMRVRSWREDVEERGADFWFAVEDEENFTLGVGEGFAATMRFPNGNNQIVSSKVAVIDREEFYIQVYLISSQEVSWRAKREFWKVVNSLEVIE